jgi:hypothetical protein
MIDTSIPDFPSGRRGNVTPPSWHRQTRASRPHEPAKICVVSSIPAGLAVGPAGHRYRRLVPSGDAEGTGGSTVGDEALDELVHRADLDALISLVDDRTAAGDWIGLRRARDRARAAVSTGRQLWPVATLAEYRLALLAPSDWAAPMIAEDAGLFTVGPLTEVVAQEHTWSELAPFLPGGPRSAVVAHERVLRGETIAGSTDDLPPVLEMPFEIAAWEPAYALANYSDNGVEAPAPPLPTLAHGRRFERPVGWRPAVVDDEPAELAVRQLVEAWTVDSNGRADMIAVEGSAVEAVMALGVGSGTIAEIALADALAWMAWAGASGGAHGRRRGAALGRFGALWTLATLLDVIDDWPLPLTELGELAGDVRWF